MKKLIIPMLGALILTAGCASMPNTVGATLASIPVRYCVHHNGMVNVIDTSGIYNAPLRIFNAPGYASVVCRDGVVEPFYGQKINMWANHVKEIVDPTAEHLAGENNPDFAITVFIDAYGWGHLENAESPKGLSFTSEHKV